MDQREEADVFTVQRSNDGRRPVGRCVVLNGFLNLEPGGQRAKNRPTR